MKTCNTFVILFGLVLFCFVLFDFIVSDGGYFEDNRHLVAIVDFLLSCFEVLYHFHCSVLIDFILFYFVWFSSL